MYDADGNVLNDGITTNYAYDSEGRPVTVGNTTASYDAFNRVVEMGSAGSYTQIVYAPDGFKFAYMNGQTMQKYIAPLAGGLQAVYTASTAPYPTYWRHADWLGSSRLATTPAQTVYYDGAYAPFGENYVESGTHDRSFTAQTQDMTSPYYDFLFRQQSSAQGRWMVPDPAGLAAVDLTNPQTWNRYAYVGNNPLNARDPLGLYLCDGADGDTEEECNGNGGQWIAEPGDPGYIDNNTPVVCYQQCGPPSDGQNNNNPALNGTGGYGANDVAFQPGSLAYGVFQGSAQIWNSAYSWGKAAFIGTGVVVGGTAVAAGASAAATATEDAVTVSRWGSTGLQSGDWVMNGEANWWNYILSGKWEPTPFNEVAPFSSGQEFSVPGTTLQSPSGWETFKFVFGQRIYIP